MQIINDQPDLDDIDTITLYVGKTNQKDYYDYIISIKPNRIIFNPGTENNELKSLCEQNGIICVENCTLVMLSHGTY